MHELDDITGVHDCTLLNSCKCLLPYAASDSRKEIKNLLKQYTSLSNKRTVQTKIIRNDVRFI